MTTRRASRRAERINVQFGPYDTPLLHLGTELGRAFDAFVDALAQQSRLHVPWLVVRVDPGHVERRAYFEAYFRPSLEPATRRRFRPLTTIRWQGTQISIGLHRVDEFDRLIDTWYALVYTRRADGTRTMIALSSVSDAVIWQRCAAGYVWHHARRSFLLNCSTGVITHGARSVPRVSRSIATAPVAVRQVKIGYFRSTRWQPLHRRKRRSNQKRAGGKSWP